jgi:DNA-directed RNA polymerase specialized sigma24 family protein
VIILIITAHCGGSISYAYKIVGDLGHAEDVVQEAYLCFNVAAGDQAIADLLTYSLFHI